jgi:hypothetical protein
VVSLLGQILAVVAAGFVLRAMLAGRGARLGAPRAVGLAALLLLTVTSVAAIRESWHALDVQRTAAAHLSPVAGRSECEKVAIDAPALGWVASRIPVRGRFYLVLPYNPAHTGEICMRFVLLPRLQVPRLAQARYVVFWRSRPPAMVAALRRRGAVIEAYGSQYGVARLP